MILNRRSLMTTALTLGAMKAFPGLSYAQARPLVFATFTGSWEEAHKAVLVPAFRKANSDAAIVLDPMLSVDQIAKINAAKANPPIDVMLHDPGPALVAIGQDLAEPYPVEKSAYYKDLITEAQEPMGPAPFFQVVGLTYNPEAVKTPPTSWADLWKPEFKGRVGITNLNSTLGTGWLVEIAKMRGGSEANVDPAFKAIEELKPNLAAVAANPGRARNPVPAGPDRHLARQFQRHPDPEGPRRSGRVRGAEGRRDRLQDHDPHRQELAEPRARLQADRGIADARRCRPR